MHPAPDLDPIPFDPVPTASTRHDGWRARGTESFRAAWDVVVDQVGAVASSTAIERAFEGRKVPAFYRGAQVGERRRYDNGLPIAALGNCRQAVAAPTRRLRWFGAIGRRQSIADSVTFV